MYCGTNERSGRQQVLPDFYKIYVDCIGDLKFFPQKKQTKKKLDNLFRFRAYKIFHMEIHKSILQK